MKRLSELDLKIGVVVFPYFLEFGTFARQFVWKCLDKPTGILVYKFKSRISSYKGGQPCQHRKPLI
jgi:hypothetical protein